MIITSHKNNGKQLEIFQGDNRSKAVNTLLYEKFYIMYKIVI